ncbi:unnamed protein product [Vicia faba]|uniref:Uncharacterized protein n=1 Tax=Vicia faba TaxID=3906 RepID=A0AAV0ZPA6_VICFA|nr:unnamed protein product [Vicia faba]
MGREGDEESGVFNLWFWVPSRRREACRLGGDLSKGERDLSNEGITNARQHETYQIIAKGQQSRRNQENDYRWIGDFSGNISSKVQRCINLFCSSGLMQVTASVFIVVCFCNDGQS